MNNSFYYSKNNKEKYWRVCIHKIDGEKIVLYLLNDELISDIIALIHTDVFSLEIIEIKKSEYESHNLKRERFWK